MSDPTAELAKLLDAIPGAMPVHQALGFMTAFVSTPTMVPPTQWVQELLADADPPTEAHARKLVDALMRTYNDIVDRLEAGKPVGPASDDDAVVAAWCRGYHTAACYDELWLDDQDGMTLLMPFAAVAGDGEADDAEDKAAMEQLGAEWKGKIPALVARIHRYWADARREGAEEEEARAQPFRREEPKIGRNEPCPCGSGKKYKRCCGAAN
jgi:uncharacterized protein